MAFDFISQISNELKSFDDLHIECVNNLESPSVIISRDGTKIIFSHLGSFDNNSDNEDEQLFYYRDYRLKKSKIKSLDSVRNIISNTFNIYIPKSKLKDNKDYLNDIKQLICSKIKDSQFVNQFEEPNFDTDSIKLKFRSFTVIVDVIYDDNPYLFTVITKETFTTSSLGEFILYLNNMNFIKN